MIFRDFILYRNQRRMLPAQRQIRGQCNNTKPELHLTVRTYTFGREERPVLSTNNGATVNINKYMCTYPQDTGYLSFLWNSHYGVREKIRLFVMPIKK